MIDYLLDLLYQVLIFWAIFAIPLCVFWLIKDLIKEKRKKWTPEGKIFPASLKR